MSYGPFVILGIFTLSVNISKTMGVRLRALKLGELIGND